MGNFMDTKILIEISKIIITALFTYWMTSKRERNNRIYEANKELLIKVYIPILRIINDSEYPGDGYEGLHDSEVTSIISLIDDNITIIDCKLEIFC